MAGSHPRLARIPVLVAAVLTVASLFLVACGSDDTPDAATTPLATAPAAVTPPEGRGPSPGATATRPPATERIEPDGERIFADVVALSDGIGPRPAGTEQEYEAALMIAERLRGLGYDVELQEFPIGSQLGRSSVLSIESPQSRTVVTLPIANSGTRNINGAVVAAGLGRPEEFTPASRGAIALVQRGDLFFNEKVANAVAAGAIGVIIYNNAEGVFYGSLSDPVSIPVVAISGSEGEAILRQAQAGEVRARISVGDVSDETSFNVIASPPGRDCETVTGGHYDSVPQAPGASDNATGTAAVLEIAMIMARNGNMGANCFVLFGAEEIGLVGSAYYVEELSQAERGRIRAMLNFDMVGVGEEAWWLIGTAELQDQMADLADELGIRDVSPSVLIRGLSSDHASFINAGIPALMFHRWEDNLLHTPQDVSGRVEPVLLEEAARMGVALLEALGAGS